jgi:hypothetical protein
VGIYERLDDLECLGVDWKITLKANISSRIKCCGLDKFL